MSITAAQVNELRKATGAGLMDCKKALQETDGDQEKAVDYLRKGNISASALVLREIAEKYDDTPQAIEARRLLSQLPSDLR